MPASSEVANTTPSLAGNAADILGLEALQTAEPLEISTLESTKSSILEPSTHPPILNLPPEILSEIFLHFLPPYPDSPPFIGRSSPTCLILVCREWNSIAISTPALWRALQLGFNPCSLPWRKGGIALAQLWLDRSGCLPLSIHASDMESQDVFPIFDVLVPYCHRWEHLTLAINEYDNLHAMAGLSMPLLRTLDMLLEIDDAIYSPLTLHDMPLLRSVVLEDNWEGKSVELPWSQLTSLTLTSLFLDECIVILRETPNLVNCTLQLVVSRTPEDPYPDLSLLRLKTLVLKEDSHGLNVHFLQRLITPALLYLELPEPFPSSSDTGCVDLLKAFVSKSGCMLNELRVIKSRSAEGTYMDAFPDIKYIIVSARS
ncbi:F-box domain-containing protein [Favolaschia claudopus]|uniref:F-box domain-containing protein n=1 Tax=Favolaschia claudopus TaxID=2862362 RepID=A0AAW0APH9_9AGAR